MSDGTQEPAMGMTDAKLFPWWIILLWGILTLIIGCMFLFWPGQTMELSIVFLGAYWLVGGIFTIASLVADRSNMGLKIFLSAINIIAGILVLGNPILATITGALVLVAFIGFWACFVGAAHLYQAYRAKDAGHAVLGIISVIFGVLLLVNYLAAIIVAPFVFGGFAVVSGLASIYLGYTAKGMQDSAAA